MRSFYSVDQVRCTPVSNKERTESSSESNDDDRCDDFDESFAKFLKDNVFDQPAPAGNYDNVIGK